MGSVRHVRGDNTWADNTWKERAVLVTTTIEGPVAVIRLTDGKHRNALSPAMSLALEVAVENAVAQGSRALVLCAEPPVFCAGGSLDSLLARNAPLGDTYRGFQALLHAPVPTVAAVDGPAIGAGVNLPLCCDVVLVSGAARFDPRFLDLCIHPGGGALWHLQRRVGRQGAAAMVLMGDVLEGEDAVAHGLAWRCVESGDLDGAALSLARRAAERDPELVARTRDTLAASMLLVTADEAVELEQEAQEWSMGRPEFTAAVRRVQAALARQAPSARPR
jgi:enoyl-CoA hydratase